MARNHSKGKVYMIRSKDVDCVPYVGSTTKQYLSQRMVKHRNSYKYWKKNPKKNSFVSCYTLFEKFGIENCFIELLELFPCNCNDELRKKEREWFDKLNCVNIVRPFITKEENYYETHKIEIAETRKIHYDEYKEEILKKNKEYRDKHKEEIIIKDKIRYHKNKEQINEKKKETYECPCGSICRKSDKNRHNRSKKHQKYLTTISTHSTIA
jgi:hypothetical protein